MSSVPNEGQLRLAVEQLLESGNSRDHLSHSYPPTPHFLPQHPQFPQTSTSHNNDLTSSVPCPYHSDISHSHSLPSVRQEYVLSEDFFAGYRHNGAMSNVRRFFCLFITFDLLFTTFLWLICVILTGGDFHEALLREVVKYNVHSSLFDVVMAAICRFAILLLFYAIIYTNHWLIIAMSTSGTCVFLIAKVFVFDWHTSGQPVFPVLLILSSFILSWSEAWFLDFKVIPQEWLAKIISSQTQQNENERTSLIPPYYRDDTQSLVPTESYFYSPYESMHGSIIGDEVKPLPNTIIEEEIESPERLFSLKPFSYSSTELKELIDLGKQNANDAWDLANRSLWDVFKTNSNGDVIFTMTIPKNRKIYKIKAQLDVAAEVLYNDLVHQVDATSTWNSAVKKCQRIQLLDDNTDIVYIISKDVGGGLVQSRDFINLRHWTTIEKSYVQSIISIDHPNLPKHPKYVRGENGLGCWIIEPLENSKKSCSFVWVLNTPVFIPFVPHLVIDNVFANTMFNFMSDLREHLTQLSEQPVASTSLHRYPIATALNTAENFVSPEGSPK